MKGRTVPSEIGKVHCFDCTFKQWSIPSGYREGTLNYFDCTFKQWSIPSGYREGTLNYFDCTFKQWSVPSGYREVQCNFQVSNGLKSTLRKIYRSLQVGKLFEQKSDQTFVSLKIYVSGQYYDKQLGVSNFESAEPQLNIKKNINIKNILKLLGKI